jgi:putative ABC transport system permease protein
MQGRGLIGRLARRNLASDAFGTLCAIVGVALGTATVDTVLIIDVNTRVHEARSWATNPDLDVEIDLDRTVRIEAFRADGTPTLGEDAKEETHEDYQVMRSAIRLGSLSAFMVGALIVFFTFGVVVERRKREIALLRSLGALPRQVAGVIVLESLIVGVTGAAVGLFLSLPMSVAVAMAGITTTGRAQLHWLYFPWKAMLFVAAIGAGTAVLGVARPAWQVLRLDVAGTLRPRFMDGDGDARRSSGLVLLVFPFMALLYLLMRPFFRELLPSLAFFVAEAGLVCLAFLAVLVFVPEVIRGLAAVVARLLPRGPAAARLLVVRRVQNMGHELAWSIAGLMLVFGMLLSLHVVTRSLKLEVRDWAVRAIRPYTYVYGAVPALAPARRLPELPPEVAVSKVSGRTPWPNSVYAVDRPSLQAVLRAGGREDLAARAERLGPGRVLVSSMMARRFDVGVGDHLEITSVVGRRRLEIVAVDDELGYLPSVGPYRNGKTYAVLDRADLDLIEPYVRGAEVDAILADPAAREGPPPWLDRLRRLDREENVFVHHGTQLEADRLRETDRDFAIFDLILALTTLLAAIGIANNMVLAVHGRRREIALYRVLGMTADQVRQMFLMEGAFVGLLGGPLAAALGAPLGYAAVEALAIVSAFDVRFDLPASYVAWTILGATVVAFVAALYPAAAAAGARSAESIHYE